MRLDVELKDLINAGLTEPDARTLLSRIEAIPGLNAPAMWTEITRNILTREIPFEIHSLLFRSLFSEWDTANAPPPAWTPSEDDVRKANVTTFSAKAGVEPRSLHAWSVNERESFWKAMIDTLGIRFHTPPAEILEPSLRADAAVWLPGAKMNIAESCFQASGDETAIVYRKVDQLEHITYDELDRLSNRIANSFRQIGIGEGDAVAIDMPMTVEAVAAYLGIVKMGGVVVSIADSFAEDEIATRLRIANASTVLTQDIVVRGPKRLLMYEKVTGAGAGTIIVIPNGDTMAVTLREGDHAWHDFLVEDDAFTPVPCNPEQTTNVLFSSGTTGDPKAIPWTHTTPIKCAMDGYL
ncbi:MAG: AMP-binding protein, partial [bacterium]|nr:AMP-binding protein [bacterium]